MLLRVYVVGKRVGTWKQDEQPSIEQQTDWLANLFELLVRIRFNQFCSPAQVTEKSNFLPFLVEFGV